MIDDTQSDIWFVGNSQLITSVLAAYCSPERHAQTGRDWHELRVSRGCFEIESGQVCQFLACNMAVLGDPAVVNTNVTCSSAMLEFARMVAPNARTIVVMLRGNEFGMHSLVDSPRWDFSFQESRAAPGRPYVRQGDALAYFGGVMNSIQAGCMLFRQLFPQARIVHVAAPAPVESEPHIRANPESFAALFERHGIRPFAQRQRIYEACYVPLAQTLSDYRIDMLRTPRQSLTERGGLHAAHAHGCLHGNAQYGRALMHELIQLEGHASL